MGNFEAFSQESSEIKEIDWVKQQVMAELQDLQKESFYSTWDDGKVNYDMEAVKNYLTTIQQKNWSDLTSKNSSAWIMAVQIALEERGDWCRESRWNLRCWDKGCCENIPREKWNYCWWFAWFSDYCEIIRMRR